VAGGWRSSACGARFFRLSDAPPTVGSRTKREVCYGSRDQYCPGHPICSVRLDAPASSAGSVQSYLPLTA
jgi:hypothetical protein